MHKTWARAEQSRHSKESHDIFPKDMPAPRRITFYPSFEKEAPAMGLILGWEYGRQWLKEHKEFIHRELSLAKPLFIDPDFGWWVNKRATVLDRRQFYLKNKLNPHSKNCNLSAFAKSKTNRKKRAGSGNESSDQADRSSKKAKKCNCKDCMQRRCGGQQKNLNQYNFQRKIITMPWY